MKQSISEIKERIAELKRQIVKFKPPRLSSEDIEDISDNYQAKLDYREFKMEAEEEIKWLETQLNSL